MNEQHPDYPRWRDNAGKDGLEAHPAAKADGGAGVEGQEAYRSMRLKYLLPKAFEQDQFFISLQPVFTMPSRRIIAAEVLLRWNMPEEGILFPAEFMPVAAREGLLMPLDMVAVSEACKCLLGWQVKDVQGIPLGVKISVAAMKSKEFMGLVEEVVAAGRLQPGMLEFEFAARDILQNASVVIKTVRRLRQMGCRCALQGYGQSESALSSILPLGMDTIKMDCGAYAPNCEPEGISTCLRVYDAVKSLGTEAVCEKVEHQMQLQELMAAGVDRMQGYALSMPVSTHVFNQMMEKHGADKD